MTRWSISNVWRMADRRSACRRTVPSQRGERRFRYKWIARKLLIINQLSTALKDVMAQQEVKTALISQGAMPVYTTSDQARSQINDEVARWAKVSKEANIKAD